MLTISVLEELNVPDSPSSHDKTLTTSANSITDVKVVSPDQKEADEFIKVKIKQILSKEEETIEVPGDSVETTTSSRRANRNFWKNIRTYLTTGGILLAHIAGVWGCRFISYKLISNKEIMAFRRR